MIKIFHATIAMKIVRQERKANQLPFYFCTCWKKLTIGYFNGASYIWEALETKSWCLPWLGLFLNWRQFEVQFFFHSLTFVEGCISKSLLCLPRSFLAGMGMVFALQRFLAARGCYTTQAWLMSVQNALQTNILQENSKAQWCTL